MSVPFWVGSWALALNALASGDIQDDLSVTRPAVNRKAGGLGVVGDPEEPMVPSALGAGDPSVHWDQFIRFFRQLQHLL